MVPLNDFPEKKSLSDLREIEKNLTTEKRIRLFWESVKILREKLNRKGNLEKLSRSTKALKEIFEIYSDKIEKTPIRENLDFLIEQKLFSILWNTKSWEPYALEKIKNDLRSEKLIFLPKNAQSIGGFTVKSIKDSSENEYFLPLDKNTVYGDLEVIFERKILDAEIFYKEKISFKRKNATLVEMSVLSSEILK